MRVEHDLAPGPIRACQVCGSGNLELVIDLGHQPLCDSLLTREQLHQPETHYPLRQLWCRECTLSQIDYVVPGDVVFFRDYPYRSGITRELATYQHAISAEIIDGFRLAPGSLVVDIGSNDGTLLAGFKSRGMQVVGVEPTNIARIAVEEHGIPTVQDFFCERVAREIVKEHGRAAVVTGTNVFAHVAALGEVIRGIRTLLVDDGIIMLESHYLLQILTHAQFDTIYHEHLRSYSLRSLVTLFAQYGMRVIDARQVDRYGGNIRVFASSSSDRPISPRVAEILREEEAYGLHRPEVYAEFTRRSHRIKDALLELAVGARRKGLRLVGNSCPGRCSTLLNFCGIGPDLMPYLAEQPTSLKLGLHLPGKHIPVVDNQILIEEQPDYVVLLAWHYWEPISRQLRARGLRSQLVVPFPELRIIA